MTRSRLLTLTLTGLASACVGLNFGSDEDCERACKNASICGLLPSAIGHGATEAEAIADCERLCGASPRDTRAADLLHCLTTLDSSVDYDRWCADPSDKNYTNGDVCAYAAACLTEKFPEDRVFGYVDLEVALISFVDFDYIFGDGAAVGLYDDRGADLDVGLIQSCTVGLCGPQRCMQYEADGDPGCEPGLCGLEASQIRRACNDLSVIAVDLVVRQNGRDKPARQTLLDEASATTCKESSLVFDSATYHIEPGPLRASARVTGILPAADLKQIGYDVGAAADDDFVEYCLEFVGMNMLGRGGDGLVFVPFGDVNEIVSYLTNHGVTIPRCDR